MVEDRTVVLRTKINEWRAKCSEAEPRSLERGLADNVVTALTNFESGFFDTASKVDQYVFKQELYLAQLEAEIEGLEKEGRLKDGKLDTGKKDEQGNAVLSDYSDMRAIPRTLMEEVRAMAVIWFGGEEG